MSTTVIVVSMGMSFLSLGLSAWSFRRLMKAERITKRLVRSHEGLAKDIAEFIKTKAPARPWLLSAHITPTCDTIRFHGPEYDFEPSLDAQVFAQEIRNRFKIEIDAEYRDDAYLPAFGMARIFSREKVT